MCRTIHRPLKSPYDLVRSGGSTKVAVQGSSTGCSTRGLTGGDGRVKHDRRRPFTYVSRSRCWRPKLFWPRLFLMLGRHNVVPRITLERHTPRSGQKAAVHGHGGMVRGAWFASHQEPGSLISGRGWRCPTVVCSWSPVTLGPALELVTLKGGLRRRRGSRSLNWSWSRWIWSVRMVHGFECISVAAQARWRSGQDGGTRRWCINLHCRWTRHLMKLT